MAKVTTLSLDLNRSAPILVSLMNRLRAIIVALLTLAVAALPAASVSAAMVASGAAPAAAQADCANHVMTVQAKTDQAKGHCADHAACGGKCLCLGLSAVLPAASGTRISPLLPPATGRVAVSLNGPAYIPPSPPPRV